MTEFQPFPKIARLNRDITITEKIDGTNAAVVIVQAYNVTGIGAARADQARRDNPNATILEYLVDADLFKESSAIALVGDYAVFAQSRTRFITPSKSTDNYGFAGWVRDNAQALVETLGEGTHFGEWWGAGIQRGYGLKGDDKRFSLFNTSRWANDESRSAFLKSGIPGLRVVPVLYEGPFNQKEVDLALERLRIFGSFAAASVTRPPAKAEGVVIFHHASRDLFKVTLEGDEAPKNLPRDQHGNAQVAA